MVGIAKLCALIKNDPTKADVLESVVADMAKMLKHECPNEYKRAFMKMHKAFYGGHFCEVLAKKAVAGMDNADGTKGGRWTFEQTEALRNQFGLKCNAYDWYYVLNMMYSDYGKVLGADQSMYVRMADAYLNDVDAPADKALEVYVWTHDLE